ncbi:MAG: AsmA family protein [Hyphomicrobiaceae bacterium]|nr:AsmA family protein [Hyphomicrobiaceae bacterium]
MPNDRASRPPPSLGQVRPDRIGGASAPGPLGPAQRGHVATPAEAYRAPHGTRRHARRTQGRVGRGMLYGLLGLLAAGSALVLIFPPADFVKQRLAAEVERQTGRRLSMGSAGVSIVGELGVTMLDVVLSAPPGMGGPPLLKADRLEVSVALLPLVLREVKIERMALTRPVLELRVDGQGRRSWDFAANETDAVPVRYAQAGGRINDAGRLPPELREFAKGATPPTASDARSPLGMEGLSLADVRVAGGTVRYRDATAGIERELKGIDARFALPQGAGPLDVDGHVVVGGERLAVVGRIDTLREMMAEQPASLRLEVGGAPVALRYEGKVVAGGSPSLEGSLSLSSGSVARLAHLLGVTVTGLDALGKVTVDGGVKATATSLDLSAAKLSAAGSTASGQLSVDAGKAKPRVVASLRFAALDLDRALAIASGTRLPPPADGKASPGRFAAPVAVMPPGASKGPASIDDILMRPDTEPTRSIGGPEVRGFRQRIGNQWDIEPIDVAGLHSIDLDGRFQIAELIWQGIRASSVQAAAELKDGHLRASITDGDVAGGKVRGLVSIDARQPALTVGANLSGDGVALAPLLKTAGIDVIEGRGRGMLTLSARGQSERDLVSTLAGKAELRATDGALIGWNAEAILASLRRGEIPPTRREPDSRTPFRQLSATFQIATGVARTRDVALDSATITASGAGLINLVDRNVDITFKPQVAGGTGIEVPVRVAGPWDEPSVVPDIAGALKSPQAQQAVRQLKEGNVEGAVRSVLGDSPKTDKKIDKAKELLRGLFNP